MITAKVYIRKEAATRQINKKHNWYTEMQEGVVFNASYLHGGMHHQAALGQIRGPLGQRQSFQENAPVELKGLGDVVLMSHGILQAALKHHHPGFALGN